MHISGLTGRGECPQEEEKREQNMKEIVKVRREDVKMEDVKMKGDSEEKSMKMSRGTFMFCFVLCLFLFYLF